MRLFDRLGNGNMKKLQQKKPVRLKKRKALLSSNANRGRRFILVPAGQNQSLVEKTFLLYQHATGYI
jgi:hypothetical protein